MKRPRVHRGKNEREQIDGFRPFPVYIILACAFVIIAIGLYLTLKDQFASGTTLPGRSGQGGGQRIVLNGPGMIVIGALVAIYPLVELFQKARHR